MKDLVVSGLFIVNIILYTIVLRRYDRIISNNYSDISIKTFSNINKTNCKNKYLQHMNCQELIALSEL